LAELAPEAFWLLEHDPVITTGRRSVGVLPSSGIDVVHTERGGLATWHGPGQLVGYLIVDVAGRGGSVKGTVAGIEQGIMQWLEGQGIQSTRRCGYPGVWVGRSKLCAVGLHFRRGVCMHGFALNLTADLAGYSDIIPCGIVDGEVTSVAEVLGRSATPMVAAQSVGRCIVDTLGLGG
jgi:lipoate-protein ligase B